jgi:hypothetical protein
VKQAQSNDTRKIKEGPGGFEGTGQGSIATWQKPFSAWDPVNEDSHEDFRRDQVVMGMVSRPAGRWKWLIMPMLWSGVVSWSRGLRLSCRKMSGCFRRILGETLLKR